jgi:kinesin family protein 6/9
MRDIFQGATKGLNGTVFAYGQTGSGKTFTISGSPNNFNYRGIIPRGITRLFQELGGKPDYDFVVKISYLEIYNESVFDLLSPLPPSEQKGEITFQEDSKGNVVVKGLSKHIVNSEEEAFNLLFEGESNRTISEHQLNKESTRSHCIFTVNLEMKSKVESSEKVMISKLNFVDLAGSERVKKTGSTGIALKEAAYINKSLTFLEQVVVALTDKTRRKDYVPYRQSKLTHILKDSIGGNCKTVMIATIWPEEPYILETLSTLNFAKRMKNVVNEVSVNITLDPHALIKKLTKEIKELKQEIQMHNTLNNRGKINYDPYTPEEQYVQQVRALKFLNGEDEDIDFDSVRMAKELFNQCRILFQKEFSNTQELISNKGEELDRKQSKLQTVLDDGVGEIEEKPSFGIGRAPKDARPITKLEQTSTNIQGMMQGSATGVENEEGRASGNGNVLNDEEEIGDIEDSENFEEEVSPENIPDKNTAFQIYKNETSTAKEIEEAITQTSADLKKKKETARELIDEGSKLKVKIDELKEKLNEKKQNKLNLADEMTNVIDDEECKLIDELKGVRQHYKEVLDNFKQTKVDINEMRNNLDTLKIKYVDSFENWFYRKYRIKVEEHELRLAKAKYGVNVNEEQEKEKVIDPGEVAYANAKKKVQSIHKAKRLEKKVK